MKTVKTNESRFPTHNALVITDIPEQEYYGQEQYSEQLEAIYKGCKGYDKPDYTDEDGEVCYSPRHEAIIDAVGDMCIRDEDDYAFPDTIAINVDYETASVKEAISLGAEPVAVHEAAYLHSDYDWDYSYYFSEEPHMLNSLIELGFFVNLLDAQICQFLPYLESDDEVLDEFTNKFRGEITDKFRDNIRDEMMNKFLDVCHVLHDSESDYETTEGFLDAIEDKFGKETKHIAAMFDESR